MIGNLNSDQKEPMRAIASNIFIFKHKVTLFALVVSMLISALLASNSYATNLNSTNGKSVMSADQVLKEEVEKSTVFTGSVGVSRSTNLYDHQDGSRFDSLDFSFIGGAGFTNGHSLSMSVGYSNDLRDPENTAAGLLDPSLKYSFKSTTWAWSAPYVLTFRPAISTVIPMSKVSTQRDELQGSLSGSVAFGIVPDGIYKSDGVWSVFVGLSAGQNFYAYEENINGTVLNKYSSNQSMDISYSIADFSFSLSYLHRSRWTYQGNIRDSFALGQEIGYSLNDNFAMNVGHSNEGAMIKANGYESNFDVIDENASSVYMGISASM